MFSPKAAFSGFTVNDLAKAKEFYTKTLGLKLADESMGLQLDLPGGGSAFVYEKPDHEPAKYTMLNFVVDDIDAAVEELGKQGVTFERYPDMPMQQDEKGIARGLAANMGPDIAWFTDPAGNILAVLQPSK
jgi:catechol 2,3-dioxygenase-like lactoylglutathione lyase family enzyme